MWKFFSGFPAPPPPRWGGTAYIDGQVLVSHHDKFVTTLNGFCVEMEYVENIRVRGSTLPVGGVGSTLTFFVWLRYVTITNFVDIAATHKA